MILDTQDALKGYIGQSRACESHDTREFLNKIKAPTLIMLGDNDKIASPKWSRELSEMIPDARLRVFDGLGHGFWRERQQQVDKIVLDFLLEA